MEPRLNDLSEDLAGPVAGQESPSDTGEQEPEKADVGPPFRLRHGAGGNFVEDEPVPGGGEEEGGLSKPEAEGRPSAAVPPDLRHLDPRARGLSEDPGLPAREHLRRDLFRDRDAPQERAEDLDLAGKVDGDERGSVDPRPHRSALEPLRCAVPVPPQLLDGVPEERDPAVAR